MSTQRILETVRGFDGVLEIAPQHGSEYPEIAWGDYFFYYAPDGQVPQREQPYATIVTKNYPDDTLCDLDPPERWRLNIHAGKAKFTELIGQDPRADVSIMDISATDTPIPHPIYGSQGWIAIVNPGDRTLTTAIALLRRAHEDAKHRARRRRPATAEYDANR